MLREERGQCTSCASADLSQSAVHLHCVVDGALLNPMVANSHAWSCEEADLASLGWNAALVLDASTRVAAAAGSGLIDLHLHCVVDLADGRASTVLMFGVARKLTLRASGGSVSLSSYTQTQRPF